MSGLEHAQGFFEYIGWKFVQSFVPLGAKFSAASLLSALVIAVAFLLLRRSQRRKDVKAKVMLRALFPSWLYRSASFRADAAFMAFSVFLFALLFSWAILSSEIINEAVNAALIDLFGKRPATDVDSFTTKLVVTIALFLMYEWGYWTYHYLSHRLPWLWEFHKVHHTAEVLSPITNFRMHPVDTVLYQNFMAVTVGVTGGTLGYLLGGEISIFHVNGTNLILLAFIFVTVHLQHSHIWIAAPGPLGRVLMSPAHHQLHHSENSAHFDKNFGSCLSLWDWMFGTLQMPERRREHLTFGVGQRRAAHHTVIGSLITPFAVVFASITAYPKRLQRS